MENTLTKAEEEIMQVLWDLDSAFVKEIVAKLPNDPAYNTVSTIVRILEKKGFVEHEAFGRTHKYSPVVSKKDYTKGYMKRFLKGYFENSYKSMLSFFAEEDELSITDIEEIQKIIQAKTKKSEN